MPQKTMSSEINVWSFACIMSKPRNTVLFFDKVEFEWMNPAHKLTSLDGWP